MPVNDTAVDLGDFCEAESRKGSHRLARSVVRSAVDDVVDILVESIELRCEVSLVEVDVDRTLDDSGGIFLA